MASASIALRKYGFEVDAGDNIAFGLRHDYTASVYCSTSRGIAVVTVAGPESTAAEHFAKFIADIVAGN